MLASFMALKRCAESINKATFAIGFLSAAAGEKKVGDKYEVGLSRP